MRIRNHRLPLLAVALTLALLSPLARAAELVAASQPAMHEHGVGSLRLALRDAELRIDLTCTGTDILGFEHLPRSEDEQARLEQAANLLRDGARLWFFPWDAGCRLAEVELERVALREPESDLRPPPAEAFFIGQKNGADGGQPLPGPVSAAAVGPGGDLTQQAPADQIAMPQPPRHTNIHAVYRFTCVRPDRLDHMDVALFDLFPSVRRLLTEYDTPSGQGAAELTSGEPLLHF